MMRWFERRMQFSPPDAADRGGKRCQMRRALASPVGFRVTSVEPSTALRARELQNPADLEERQLENIVCEMAIAGGVSQSRVLLMEGEAVNAGAGGKDRARSSSPGVCSTAWTATRLKG